MPHPTSGKATAPLALLQACVKPLLGKLCKRGGHPVLASRKVAGDLDSKKRRPTRAGPSSAWCATAAAATG